MPNSFIKVGKKAVTAAVTFTTIMWSVGVAGLPLAARAAIPTAPALIKASSPSVYYLATDGKRYVFPNEITFFTWYTDFSSVVTITDSELASIPIGGNVTFREGSWMGKITTDPKTYWVGKGGTLQHVPDEATAAKIAGADWNKQVRDIPDAFFTNYKVGAALSADGVVDGMLFRTVAGGQVYLVDGGKARKVTASGLTANRFQDKFVRLRTDLSVAAAAVLSPGADLTDNSYLLANNPSGAAAPGVTPTPTGAVTLETVDQPAGATLTRNASRVELLRFKASGSGKLDSVIFERSGAGASADFANLYIYEGVRRLTTGRSISTINNESTFSNLGLTISGSRTFSLVGDLIAAGAAVGNVHSFQIKSADKVSVSAAPGGTFPIRGNSFTIGGSFSGTITADVTATPSEPKVGQTAAELARVRLTSGGAEDLRVKGLRFFNTGSLQLTSLANLEIRVGGTKVAGASVRASTVTTDGQYLDAVFPDPGHLLERGTNKEYSVYGDVKGDARPDVDTLRLHFDQTADIYAVGVLFGFAVQAINNFTAALAPQLTIRGGDLTINNNVLPARTIAPQTQDNVVLNLTFTAKTDLEIRNTRVQITSTTGIDAAEADDADINDIKGVTKTTGTAAAAVLTQFGPRDGTACDDGINNNTDVCTFTDVWIVKAGSSLGIEVSFDLAAGITNGAIINVTLLPFQLGDIRIISNAQNLALANIVPNGNIASAAQTVAVASLVLAMSGSPESANVVRNGNAYFGILFSAGTAEAVKVTRLTIRGFVSVDGNVATFAVAENDSGGTARTIRDLTQSAKLLSGSITGPQVGTDKSADNNNDFVFDNLTFTVNPGETKLLIVCAKVTSVGPFGANVNAFYLDLLGAGLANGSTVNVSAETVKDGTAVTATSTNFNVAPAVQLNSLGQAANDDNPAIRATLVTGRVTFEISPGTPLSKIYAAGTSGQEFVRIKATSLDEAFLVTDLNFVLGNALDVDNVAGVDLFIAGTKVVSGQFNNAGVVKFSNQATGLGSIGSVVDLSLKLNLTEDGTGVTGADSGDRPQVSLFADTNDAVDLNEIRVVGKDSGTVLTDANIGAGNLTVTDNTANADADATTFFVRGNAMTIRKNVPTFAKAAGLSSTLVNGEQDIYAFTMTASTVSAAGVSAAVVGSDLAWRRLVFQLSEGGTITKGLMRFFRDTTDITNLVTIVDTAGNNLKNAVDTSVDNDKVIVEITGANTEEVVANGLSRKYSLKATVGGAGTGDSLNTNLIADPVVNVVTAKVADAASQTVDLCVNKVAGANNDILFFDLDGDGVNDGAAAENNVKTDVDQPAGIGADGTVTCGFGARFGAQTLLVTYDGGVAADNVFLDTNIGGGAVGAFNAANDILLGAVDQTFNDGAAATLTYVGFNINLNADGAGLADTFFLDNNANGAFAAANDVILNNQIDQTANDGAAAVVVLSRFNNNVISDTSADVHSPASADWFNGNVVPGLETPTSHTLSL